MTNEDQVGSPRVRTAPKWFVLGCVTLALAVLGIVVLVIVRIAS
jgi:hypothetical protein